MPVIDPGSIAGILADLGVSLLTYAGIAAILYSIGGILIRTISWTLDNLLISFIDKFYGYFEEILGGTIFTDSIVDGMMSRVYLLVGVLVLFKLGMLLVQYIINPAEVMDEKGGANSLVRRTIIGIIIIIFVPTIFDIANDLQVAILEDQVIEKIIMDENTLNDIEEQKAKYGTGRIIGMTVLQGFWNIDKNQISDSNIIKTYEDAEKKYDPNLVEEAGYGILTQVGGKYAYSYFPILSTIVLGYVLYLVIKYCLDMVVRSLKLVVLQVIAPITIVEYIVNGDRNEVFKNWKKAVIATYAMLFLRVFTIWFVAYVAILMQTGIDGDSLLNTQDYLLKAIIVLGLLAFMMEFPKMMSGLFGLDLEQDSSVKAMLGKVGGIGKMLGTGALIAGSAAVGGAFGRAKAGVHGRNEMKKLQQDFAKGNITHQEYNKKAAEIQKNTKDAKHAATMGGLKGVGRSAMHAVGLGSINRSFAEAAGEGDKEESKQKQKAIQAEEQAFRAHQSKVTDQINVTGQAIKAGQTVSNYKLGELLNTNQAIQAGQTVSNYKLGELLNTNEENLQETRNINVKLGTNINVDSAETMQKANDAFASGGFSYQDTIAGKQDQAINETRNINVKLGTNINVDSAETMQKANDAFASGGFSYQDTISGKLDEMSNSNSSNFSQSDTIGGVPVSSPGKNGERTTESGIILPGSIDVDNK